MLPSHGVKEGLARHGRRGLTGAGDGGDCEVTCLTSHLEADNGLVTGQAGYSDSDYDVPDGCMHTLQSAAAGRDLITMGIGDPGDAGEVCEVVHNRVHYYVHVPNSEESAYQACDRNIQIDPEFQHHLQEEEET